MQEKKKLHIVVIGGGTGTSRLISGLVKYPVKISVITNTVDEGSSSGTLRKEFCMVPPGDMRQCLGALSNNHKLADYFHARFSKGKLYGHPLGNILLALLYDYHRDIQKAIDEACMLLEIREHEVLPVTLHPTTLVAELSDKTKIIGEESIVHSKDLQKKDAHFSLLPKKLTINPRASAAIKEADAIVVSPGNLFASILPALLPSEIKNALLSSQAKKIFVVSLMTQKGHTENFSPSDFVRVIETYMGNKCFDVIFYNTVPIPKIFWNKNIGFEPVVCGKKEKHDARFVPGKFIIQVKESIVPPLQRKSAHDPFASLRSVMLHDEDAIAKKIFTYITT